MPKTRVPKGTAPPTKTNRKLPPKRTDLRSNNATKLLAMRKGRIIRDDKGTIVKGSVLSAKEKAPAGGIHRIAPDRRWFGNTRVIGQSVLQQFRDEMSKAFHDPYSVVVNAAKLPTQLLQEPKHDPTLQPKNRIEFEKTFGAKKQRKKVTQKALDYSSMASTAAQSHEKYELHSSRDTQQMSAPEQIPLAMKDDREAVGAWVNKAGQSPRIWGELYKVIDSSDVLLQVLDARDPMGTRCTAVEKYLRAEKKFKHLIFILNKCDLIPPWATKRWVAILSKENPTVAFHASVTKPFGKGNVISLIRQFASLQKQNNKKILSVGLIGYPNVGKSSVINTLRGQKVCMVAPIPGETKVWQYVALSKRIYLIDCPGVIHHSESNDETGSVLKSVIRVERLGDANKADHVKRVLEIVARQKIIDTYGVSDWSNHYDFLAAVARKRGKLRPGGLPNVDAAARMVLYDWQRARLPWFIAPPREEEEGSEAGEVAVAADVDAEAEAEGKIEEAEEEGEDEEGDDEEGEEDDSEEEGDEEMEE